jgi:hypothetical protein
MEFRISPLIKITLLLLLLALTLPLPFLAIATQQAGRLWLTVGGVVSGVCIIYLALGDRIILDDQSIKLVSYLPLKKGWQIQWSDIVALKPKTTGQGGLVYYLLTKSGEGYLLPMRVAGFSKLVRAIQAKTNLDMQDVKPLAQPWMYFILLFFSLILLLFDGWIIHQALTNHLVPYS